MAPMLMTSPASWRYLLLILCLQAHPVAAEIWDAERERTVAEKMRGSLDVGAVVWLELRDGREFPGIYARGGTDHPETALILLHGMGGHPDWPDVISPLRKSLTGMGWTTLSLQMPVLITEAPIADYGKTLNEAEKRIQAATEYLRIAGFQRMIIIGYGFGAATALYYAARNTAPDIAGIAGISVLARKYLEPVLDLNRHLQAISIPVLDIYAEDDLRSIVTSADDRRLAASQNPQQNYRQIMIAGADHYYTGQDTALMQNIDQWLQNPGQTRQAISDIPERATAQAGSEAD